jgi:hypothetical protein
MTGNAVWNSAILRGFYVAVIAGLGGALPIWTQTDNTKLIIIAFLGPFLTALGWRGGGEGGYDANRAATGNMNAGDVPVASPKVEVTKVGA